MDSITVGNRQCFLDLAMQYAGSAEAAFAMSVQNDAPITTEYPAGQLLKAPAVINEEVVTLYRTERAKPASILVIIGTNDLEGIDYWAIENDFVVK